MSLTFKNSRDPNNWDTEIELTVKILLFLFFVWIIMRVFLWTT